MKLTSATQLVIKYCESIGIDEVEAFAQSQRILEVNLEDSMIQSSRVKIHRGIGIHVIKDKKSGFTFTTEFSESGLKNACNNAYSLANVSQVNPDWVSFPSSGTPSKPPMGIYDEETANIGESELLNLINQTIDDVKEYNDNITITKGSISVILNEVAINNSLGVETEEKDTLCRGSIGCSVKNGEVLSVGWGDNTTRSLKSLSLERIIRNASEEVAFWRTNKPKTVESFIGKVILDSEPVTHILMQPIISNINADNVQRGRSQWANKIGKEVASQQLTIVDDGLRPNGMGSSSFDHEGCPRQKTPIVTHGKLENFLYNSAIANKENKKSTGNTYRVDYSMLPTIAVTNFVVETGKKTLEEMISDVDKGLIVKHFSGHVHGESGEFSGIATSSSYIENGEIKYPVKETMISGNAFQALNNIIDIGCATHPTYDVFPVINRYLRTYVPPILIDKINIVSSS